MNAALKRSYETRYHYPPKLVPKKVKYVACGSVPFYSVQSKRDHLPCWEHPITVPNQVKFGICWEYPPERYKRRPLPPPCRGTTIPLEVLKPTFEHCVNLYTRFDSQLEQCAHEQILVVDEQLDKLTHQLDKAKTLQINYTKEMRYQGVRYRLLIGGPCCTKLYPEYLSRMTEERALCEFQRAYNSIIQSNSELTQSFLKMRESMKELELRVSRLDRTLKSPFVLELDNSLQTIEDLNNYFFGVIVKMKTWSELMDPMKEHSIEDYLALLNKASNFKSFMSAGMEDCTCKRCGKSDPLKPYLPCWCQPLESSEDCDRVKDRESNFNIAAKITPSDSDFANESSDTSVLVKAAELKLQLQADQTE